MKMIPDHEFWLYKNPDTLASVRRGLKDAAKGRVIDFDPDENLKKRISMKEIRKQRWAVIKRLKGCLNEKDYRKEITRLKEGRKNWKKLPL